MNTIIQRVEFPDNRRILMLSDIHGHAEGLEKLLRQVHFSKDDILVIVGDLVEKGPESLRTVRMVMELCRTHTVYPLMGNVDMWRMARLMSDDIELQQNLLQYSLKARKWWGHSFLDELCHEIGVTFTETTDTQILFQQLREHFTKEISFLLSLPTILETQRMIFVHGGIPHENLDELAGTEALPLMKWDAFRDTSLSFKKYVAVGHWPVHLYPDSKLSSNPIIDLERRIISLDGGCGISRDGQLNLVILPCWKSDDFSFVSWDAFPQITALDTQEASASYECTRYGREHIPVIILRQQDDWADVLYNSHVMKIPAAFLYSHGKDTCCDGATNYQHSVVPGDRLALVCKASFGCLVKKNGILGWYNGRYETVTTLEFTKE